MNRSLSRLATRAAYGASQLPRIAWYLGHGHTLRRDAQAYSCPSGCISSTAHCPNA